MTRTPRHVNPGQDTTIDPTFHYDHLRSAPEQVKDSGFYALALLTILLFAWAMYLYVVRAPECSAMAMSTRINVFGGCSP